MRILITGSRKWKDIETIETALSDFIGVTDPVLVSGACPDGADFFCEEFAKSEGWSIERHPAEWKKYKKRAGYVRNAEMVNTLPDICVAFIFNGSGGSTMTAELAVNKGIPTLIYRNGKDKPERYNC